MEDRIVKKFEEMGKELELKSEMIMELGIQMGVLLLVQLNLIISALEDLQLLQILDLLVLVDMAQMFLKTHV